VPAGGLEARVLSDPRKPIAVVAGIGMDLAARISAPENSGCPPSLQTAGNLSTGTPEDKGGALRCQGKSTRKRSGIHACSA